MMNHGDRRSAVWSSGYVFWVPVAVIVKLLRDGYGIAAVPALFVEPYLSSGELGQLQVRPLPPPITVSTPSGDGYNAGSPSTNPPYTASVRNDDPSRPTPPAEIPAPPPLDLRAAANEPSNARDRAKNVAEDVLSAAKSMFHTVLPQ